MEIMDGGSVRIDRKSSIEKEPRTLNFDQIQYAREAALYVMNTMSIEDAMRIFTEGLERVESVRMDSDEDDGEEEEEEDMDDQLQVAVPVFRDVVTAPF